MTFKQKYRTMRSYIPTLVLILFFTSCITSNHVHYSDPNYLTSDEFSSYEEIAASNQVDPEESTTDTTINSSSNYTVDDYYDYSFSSRIRRFHRPIYYSGYYGGIYTNYYWYNNDPFYWGTSIYYGYNWNSPYYSHYGYTPYYYDYYYTPYYYGNYYSYNGYGYNHQNTLNGTYYNSNDHNSYIMGHRGSLSSNGGGRNINVNTTNNILQNAINKNSTFNIRDKNTINKNTTNNRNYRSNSSVKTNTSNNSNSNRTTSKKNSDRKQNSYSNTRSNQKSYNSNSSHKRSSNRNNSSRGGNKRIVKPRK
ncbi:MAG: hypothetical protein CMD28_06155 [Flavobacteriales bacterium]|nr:hypothetical protein [Flavobacteriales bacterium]